MTRKKPRSLRPEETALWDIVAGRTRPLHPNKKKPKEEPTLSKPKAPRQPLTDFAEFRVGEKAPQRKISHVTQTDKPIQMDRKAFGRMMRGKLKPEGRIDLHGMTLAEAHPALISYVMRAYADQKRLILVITGKGRDRDTAGPIPTRRGVLKHQVPIWLSQAPLGPVVLQVNEAHRSHGGGGAYYVYLRRALGR